MNEKATVSSSYRTQLGLMAAMSLAFSLWFLYDGYVKYPLQRQIAQEFAEFKEQGRAHEWPSYAMSKGWPDGTDGDPGYNHTDSNLFTQKLIGYGLVPVWLIFGIAFLRSYSKWIVAQDDALVTSGGKRMPYDAVTSFNKSRWRSKGIAVVYYQDAGRSRRFVLDNYKYTRTVIAVMVRQVELHLAPDQIVGGPPEPLPESEEDLNSEQPPSGA